MTSAWTEPVTVGGPAAGRRDQTAGVETMLEAIDRLQALGYVLDLRAAPGGRLECPACASQADAGALQVDETARFEGDSNPADESILVAITAVRAPWPVQRGVRRGRARARLDVLQALPSR